MNKAVMEEIQLLEMCRKNYTTIRRAFSRLGLREIQDGIRPFKELSEKELFAFLMNWIINRMEKNETVTIRYRVEEKTYQIRFHYASRQLLLTKPTIISTDKNFISYEWTNEDNYNEITEQKIRESIRKADERNKELQTRPSEADEIVLDLTTGIQHNLTNDEYELIESFLDG